MPDFPVFKQKIIEGTTLSIFEDSNPYSANYGKMGLSDRATRQLLLPTVYDKIVVTHERDAVILTKGNEKSMFDISGYKVYGTITFIHYENKLIENLPYVLVTDNRGCAGAANAETGEIVVEPEYYALIKNKLGVPYFFRREPGVGKDYELNGEIENCYYRFSVSEGRCALTKCTEEEFNNYNEKI